jgi:hypothetical protein
MIKYWPRQGGVLVPWIQVEHRWSWKGFIEPIARHL